MSVTIDGAPAETGATTAAMESASGATRWTRSELAVASARGALAGYMMYLALSNLSGGDSDAFISGYAVDGVADLVPLWLPIVAMYLARSPRVLSWLNGKAGTKVAALRDGAWLTGQRL